MRLVYVEGDVATNALVAVAHGVLLSVDLIYGRHDGVGAMSLTRTGGISCQTLEKISWSRPQLQSLKFSSSSSSQCWSSEWSRG